MSHKYVRPPELSPASGITGPASGNLDLFEYIRRILFGHPGRKKVTDLISERKKREEVSCVSLSAASAL